MLTEEFVKNSVVKWLNKQNYVVLDLKTLLGHGADIRAKKARSSNYFIIEAKGDASEKGRQVNFVSALGEIIQRIKHERHYRYAIALPESYSNLVYRKIPWVAAKKIKLEVLLVDNKGRVERITWRQLKDYQVMKQILS